MAQDGSKSASESPRWPPRRLKMAQDASRWLRRCSKRSQDRSKTAPSGQRARQGGPQAAQILQKPKQNQCCLPSRLFASDGCPRPQDGPRRARGTSKRAPRGPQERPKRATREPQEAQTIEHPKENQCHYLPAFSLPMAFRSLKTPSRSPKNAQGNGMPPQRPKRSRSIEATQSQGHANREAT